MWLALQVHKGVLLAPQRWQGAPPDGVVAVKVQYPDALQMMLQDLSNIRVAARFLQVGLCSRPDRRSCLRPYGLGSGISCGPLMVVSA